MTIIESALQRAKSLKPARSGPDVAPSANVIHKAARRSADPLAPPPVVNFVPQRVKVDPELARDNRLLLTSAQAEDRVAVAAYGMLRTRLLHRARSKGWTTIGITSAAPHDGKSLTSLNLALSIAREQNHSVALLDLDMRNPTMCRSLGIHPPVEMRHFFEQKVASPQDLFMSIGVDNLVLAGGVTPTDAAAELLASSRLEELLEFVKKSISNPLILVDLPPLLSPDDALVVAPRVDALMLVASEGVTPLAQMHKAVEMLGEFPVAGLVLNRSTEGGGKYAYGYGYGQK